MKYVLIIILFSGFTCTKPFPRQSNSTKTNTSPIAIYRKVISDSSNTLENVEKILKLQYTLWGCACANWISFEDVRKYKDSGFSKHHIFIEPASPELYNPASDTTFDVFKEQITVTGKFYVKDDYPHPTFQMEEQIEKARVFQYTKIKRIKENATK
ncbi:MAG: hypothetical protein KG003_04060 [Bacteroidetes bacterium]|nr:hypothetical protein [Bacteroidota bacterium]